MARGETYGLENLKESAEEAGRVAAELKDETEAAAAKYYLRVLSKLGENAGYVEKETARLGKILDKGGLAGVKRDELKRKVNVLRKFVKEEDVEEEGEKEETEEKDEL